MSSSPTTAAIFRPLRSSTLVMPESFRATIAPSTAVATPVTFTGTWSSNSFAESANDMSMASTFPAAKVFDETRRRARHDGVLGLPSSLAEEILLVDDLARRPAELEVREAHLAFPLRATGTRGKAAGQRGAGGDAGPQEIPPPQVPSISSHQHVLLAHASSRGFTRTSASTATSRPADAISGLRSSSSTAG